MLKMEVVEPDASSRNPRGQAVVSLLNHQPVHPPGPDLAPPAVPYNHSVPQAQSLPRPPHTSHVTTHHPYSSSHPSPPNNYSHSRQPTPQQQSFPPHPQYSPRPPSDPRSVIAHPPPPTHGSAVGPHPPTSGSYTPIESRPPSGPPHGGPPSSVNEHTAARPQLGLHTASMDPGTHAAYEPHPQMNGNGAAGYSHMENPHNYGSHHMAHPQSYAASPVSASPYSSQYASQYSGMPKKKHVRAQQACNHCRARKQKCDEQKPCQFCKENNMECTYKDVPPPKSDRTLMQILERLTAIEEKVDAVGGYAQLERRVNEMDHMRNSTNSQQGSVSHTTSPPQVAVTASASRLSSAREHPDDVPDEHKSGAHWVRQDWPSIEKFFEGIVDSNENPTEANYPFKMESKRGSLRLYGTGEGLTSSDIDQQIGGTPESKSSKKEDPESPASFQSPVSNPTPSSHDGMYCNGFPQAFARHLDFSPGTVLKLQKSYLDNTYGFHPFLDKSRLGKQVDRFIEKMNPTEQMAKSPHVPIGDRPNKKRKADDRSPLGDPTQFPLSGTHETLKVESTVTNAIILLVLALGAITLENDILAGPHRDKETGFPCVKAEEAEYAAGLTDFRPPGVPSTLDHEPPSKRQKMLQDLHNKDSDRPKGELNINVIPGMAYYAYASDILGNMHCGNEVFHAQAFLLASLYINQLGRGLESYSWINSAARVIRTVIKLEKPYLRHNANLSGLGTEALTRIELIKFTFWSALQLEGDILAELSLPPSHITDYEPVVGYPRGIDDSADGAAFDEHIQFLYSAQIFIRKCLNKGREVLYSKDKLSIAVNKSEYFPDADSAEAIQTTLEQVLRWRDSSPHYFHWSDSEPPTQNLNLARLRGKFYGAVYITTRPYLRSVVHCDTVHHGQLKVAWNYIQACVPGRINPLTEPQDFPSVPRYDVSRIDPNAIKAMLMVQKCISCAVASTTAFDNIQGRWKVTNIFGTLHAQFGNCLVLSAVYNSWLSELPGLLPRAEIGGLLKQCIKKCITYQHLCPALGMDAQILSKALEDVSRSKSLERTSSSFSHPQQHNVPCHQSNPHEMQRRYSHQPISANSSFSA